MKRWEAALSHIEILTDNWDSYGAKVINKEAIKLVKTILNHLPENLIPEIGPNQDGSISLYWDDKEVRVFDGTLIKVMEDL